MARYTASIRTGAGSTTLPIISLYGIASVHGRIREIGVFNTTAVAVALAIVRLSTAGTQGASITPQKEDDLSAAASLTPFTTHTVGPTVGNTGKRAVLGASVGSGVIWTFSDVGLLVPAGTANGVGVIVATGTGQVCDAYITWDE